MNREYILKNYILEKLTITSDLSNFECESEDLTNFLIDDALKQQEQNLSTTQIVKCDNEIIGFYSLLTDSIDLRNIRQDKSKELIKEKLPKSKKITCC
ncbi:MAG: N-acetyltransferase [Methanobrevibacter sp. CfCl-M3]